MAFAFQDIGKTVYTPREVVDEIRDKATRRSLAVLPYQLNLRQPADQHVRFGNGGGGGGGARRAGILRRLTLPLPLSQ